MQAHHPLDIWDEEKIPPSLVSLRKAAARIRGWCGAAWRLPETFTIRYEIFGCVYRGEPGY